MPYFPDAEPPSRPASQPLRIPPLPHSLVLTSYWHISFRQKSGAFQTILQKIAIENHSFESGTAILRRYRFPGSIEDIRQDFAH